VTKCPICGAFIIREENPCFKVGDITFNLVTIYVCEKGHRVKVYKDEKGRRVSKT